MNAMSKNMPYWFIREGDKLIQCSKADFDQAIQEGKSVKYRTYPSKKVERIAEILEASRMALLNDPTIPTKFRQTLTDPVKVIQVQVIDVDDPEYWNKEARHPKYQTLLKEK
jgi:phenolic acid decarboxylase